MEKETRPFIPWQLADDFMTAVFEKVGVPEADARLCSDDEFQTELSAVICDRRNIIKYFF